MIHVGFSELRGAFIKHSAAAQPPRTTTSHFLILFYAIECGLKSIYLRRHGFRTSAQICQTLKKDGHDLALWAKELRLPASVAGNGADFRLARDASSRWRIAKAHQAWRYGAMVEDVDQQTLVAWLTRVKQWISENIK